MDGWTAAWLLWIVYGLVVEFDALLTRQYPGTLSEHVWKWFSMTQYGKWWRLRRFVLLAGLAWLAAHLLTGGKF